MRCCSAGTNARHDRSRTQPLQQPVLTIRSRDASALAHILQCASDQVPARAAGTAARAPSLGPAMVDPRKAVPSLALRWSHTGGATPQVVPCRLAGDNDDCGRGLRAGAPVGRSGARPNDPGEPVCAKLFEAHSVPNHGVVGDEEVVAGGAERLGLASPSDDLGVVGREVGALGASHRPGGFGQCLAQPPRPGPGAPPATLAARRVVVRTDPCPRCQMPSAREPGHVDATFGKPALRRCAARSEGWFRPARRCLRTAHTVRPPEHRGRGSLVEDVDVGE